MMERVGTGRGAGMGEYSTYFSLMTRVKAESRVAIDTARTAGFLPRKFAKRQ
jgi:hypothetical protein